jgi:ADP-ribosylation factor-like protein 4
MFNKMGVVLFFLLQVKGTTGRARGISFLVWDVGGQEKLRPLWRSYTRCTDGIVFVVDSVDAERMEEARMELLRTAKSPENAGVPVLVLANKQDLPGAREPREVEKLLGLHELPSCLAPPPTTNTATSPSSQPGTNVGTSGGLSNSSHHGPLYHVQPACAITGDGLDEGMEALYEMILKRRKLAKQCKKKAR